MHILQFLGQERGGAALIYRVRVHILCWRHLIVFKDGIESRFSAYQPKKFIYSKNSNLAKKLLRL